MASTRDFSCDSAFRRHGGVPISVPVRLVGAPERRHRDIRPTSTRPTMGVPLALLGIALGSYVVWVALEPRFEAAGPKAVRPARTD